MKKILSLLIASAMICVSVVACGETSLSDAEQKSSSEETVQATDDDTNELSAEYVVELVKSAVADNVGEDEKIESVTLENRDLKVVADISKAEIPDGFELSWLAESRVSSITDAILDLPEIKPYWDTVTVEIASVGSITFCKSDIQSNGYGEYFNVPAGYFD